MGVRNYDAADVSIVLGPILVTGFADGTFVNVERNEDAFTLTVGADGEACRSKTNNRSGTITFTLLQSSPSNDLLSALAITDERSSSGDGVAPFLMKDIQGTSLYTAETAWIKKVAAASYAKEPENREWTIETDNLVMGVGSNFQL